MARFNRIALVILSAFLVLVADVGQARPLLFAINEGTSSSTDGAQRDDKYKELGRYLSKALGREVQAITSNQLQTLVRNLGHQQYDLALVRPAHISARAMRDNGYRLVAAARGESKVHFLVSNDSPLKSLADLKGRFLVMPDDLAYPTALARAILRDARVMDTLGRVQYLNRQEAVGYSVENKLVDAGVVISYSKVAKEWPKKGRFLFTRDKLPYWSVIASPKVSAAELAKLQAALMALEGSPEGAAILKKAGVEGFVAGDPAAYLRLADWVDGKPGAKAP